MKYKQTCPICRSPLLGPNAGQPASAAASPPAAPNGPPNAPGGGGGGGPAAPAAVPQPNPAQITRLVGGNSVFRFESGRLSRWLPQFQFEVFRGPMMGFNVLGLNAAGGQGGGGAGGRGGGGRRRQALTPVQERQMLERVREVFPNVAENVIRWDLQRTHSVEATVQNLLSGNVQQGNIPPLARLPLLGEVEHHEAKDNKKHNKKK
eukprot:GABV01002039.1.p1 GENE.GABV01002039.1~~GABV01002039.1.p1  ORF type:complete len:206 (+),score=90.08 GABV01002039.1:1-618(+)